MICNGAYDAYYPRATVALHKEQTVQVVEKDILSWIEVQEMNGWIVQERV